MTIQSIELEHTNPSLGPHETISIVALLVTKENAQKVEQFVNNSKVNNTTSLYEYLKAIKTKNTEIVEGVLNNGPTRELASGASISNLSFYFEDGQIVRLSDVYRKFELTHFNPEFTSFMVEKGIVSRNDSGMRETLNIKPPKNSEEDV